MRKQKEEQEFKAIQAKHNQDKIKQTDADDIMAKQVEELEEGDETAKVVPAPEVAPAAEVIPPAEVVEPDPGEVPAKSVFLIPAEDDTAELPAVDPDPGEAHLAVFGIKIPLVEKAVQGNSQIFQRPPLGLVGLHVKLRGAASSSPEIAKVVQTELSRPQMMAFLPKRRGPAPASQEPGRDIRSAGQEQQAQDLHLQVPRQAARCTLA